MKRAPQVGDHIFFETGMRVNALIPLKFHPGGPVFSKTLDFRYITIGEKFKREELNDSFFTSLADNMNTHLQKLSGCSVFIEMISYDDLKKFFYDKGYSFCSETLDTATYAGEYVVTHIDNTAVTCKKLDDSEKTVIFHFNYFGYPFNFVSYSEYDAETGRLTQIG